VTSGIAGPREALRLRQVERLRTLVATIDGRSAFYTRKLREAGIDAAALMRPDDLSRLPFTRKAELVADQAQHAWGSVISEPLEAYTRYHQTSSTTGRPLRWIDTNASWQWALECWKAVFAGAHVTAADRLFFPFSFGPFLGFWTAFEAGCQIGAHCIAGDDERADRGLAQRPVQDGIGLRDLGEPGGSLAVVRSQIEARWGARVIDHYGLTEVGPVAFECWEHPGGLHVNEDEYIAEVLDHEGRPVADGEPGELVLTNLGRAANPVLRYRTGDMVRRSLEPCPCGRPFARLVGGVLARADDMVNIRGVNVYPTAVESVVRGHDAVVEFRATVLHDGPMRTLSVEIEVAPEAAPAQAVASAVAVALRDSLGLTVPVHIVAAGTLPRFEMKARRFVVAPRPPDSR
jgi:phenylacetate-CoA ligase